MVTANKRLVADWYGELTDHAAMGGATVRYSASVGGSVPLLETIGRVRRRCAIDRVSGILNGTVNFILGRMHSGVPLDIVIGEARERGFAEEDCEADLSGSDVAAKLRIVAAAAFDVKPQDVHVETRRLGFELERQIRSSGQRWVQLATVWRYTDGVRGRVTLCPLSETALPDTSAEWNVALIECRGGDRLWVHGRGAGGPATAEAVIADLYELSHLLQLRKVLATKRDRPGSVTVAAE